MGFRVACVGGFADVVGGVGEDGVDEAAFGWWVAYGAEGGFLEEACVFVKVEEKAGQHHAHDAVGPLGGRAGAECGVVEGEAEADDAEGGESVAQVAFNGRVVASVLVCGREKSVEEQGGNKCEAVEVVVVGSGIDPRFEKGEASCAWGFRYGANCIDGVGGDSQRVLGGRPGRDEHGLRRGLQHCGTAARMAKASTLWHCCLQGEVGLVRIRKEGAHCRRD